MYKTNVTTRKNLSMMSTHHLSCNQSHTTNFYSEHKGNQNIMLCYADIPMKKQEAKWNQSASTWRHHTPRYSFSKDSRFKTKTPYYTDIIRPQTTPPKMPQACTFGKGNRKPISAIVIRNALEKPSPDSYDLKNIDESTRVAQNGKSISMGRQKFQKVYIPYRKDIYSSFQTKNNPFGNYNIQQIPGTNANKFTAKGRLKMYTAKMSGSKNWVPGPHHQCKDRHLYGMKGMNDRNFSFGERIDLSKPSNNYPGPMYLIPGFCHKFSRVRQKQCPEVQSSCE